MENEIVIKKGIQCVVYLFFISLKIVFSIIRWFKILLMILIIIESIDRRRERKMLKINKSFEKY
mgnify:CR=1 FL=1